MKAGMMIIALFLVGCNYQLPEERVTRQEIAQALHERDQAIFGLARAVEQLQKKAGIKKEAKKKK